ncbi:hypothetical protein Ancab_026716 [Ancistrocladus abbreviatus]
MTDSKEDEELSEAMPDSVGESMTEGVEHQEIHVSEEKVQEEMEEDMNAEEQDNSHMNKEEEEEEVEKVKEVAEEKGEEEEEEVANEDEEVEKEKQKETEVVKEEVDTKDREEEEEVENVDKEEEEFNEEEKGVGLSSGENLQPKFRGSNEKIVHKKPSIDNKVHLAVASKDTTADLHKKIPTCGRNDGDANQEEINAVKTSKESSMEIDADIPVSNLATNVDNMEVDNNAHENGGKESIGLNTEQSHDAKSDGGKSLKCEGEVDNDSVSASHLRTDAPLSGSSAPKKELISETKTEGPPMDVNDRNLDQTFLFETDTSDGGESGTEEQQSVFMKEVENFYKEKSLEFKPPKFYGEPLNLLKLWRGVTRLGGYDKVTACKLWRQVGESFKPPKTCTTVSWTFRIFYEKALLDYERHKTCGGELSIPVSLVEPMNVENQVGNNSASGSGRARRDAAARAMQGWHSQRLLGNGEVSDPIIKDKNSIPLQKKEKQLRNIGVPKRKRPSTVETPVRVARSKMTKTQLDTTVVDIGPPADWVQINVRVTKDCYEVYALVPGLLREEVRVQSDPAGRLVITGEPENPDNPWGVTPFKKVVSLPSRIDPHQTSAVVTLHGQLFVRVPFEQSD